MGIEPLEFEEHLRVFLTLPHLHQLREYREIMRTRDPVLINRYRDAVATGNTAALARVRKLLSHQQEKQ